MQTQSCTTSMMHASRCTTLQPHQRSAESCGEAALRVQLSPVSIAKLMAASLVPPCRFSSWNARIGCCSSRAAVFQLNELPMLHVMGNQILSCSPASLIFVIVRQKRVFRHRLRKRKEKKKKKTFAACSSFTSCADAEVQDKRCEEKG